MCDTQIEQKQIFVDRTRDIYSDQQILAQRLFEVSNGHNYSLKIHSWLFYKQLKHWPHHFLFMI